MPFKHCDKYVLCYFLKLFSDSNVLSGVTKCHLQFASKTIHSVLPTKEPLPPELHLQRELFNVAAPQQGPPLAQSQAGTPETGQSEAGLQEAGQSEVADAGDPDSVKVQLRRAGERLELPQLARTGSGLLLLFSFKIFNIFF